MGRAKLPRKSTAVDMTAMCDVAFLLLSFFILTTKFKPAEAITVVTPSSVASKVAPEKDFVLITIDKDGKVFLSMDDKEKKNVIANALNTTKNVGIDAKAFAAADFIGAPLSGLKSFLALPEDQRKGGNLPGIPAKDSTNNEMVTWMRLVKDAYMGQHEPAYLVKGDNAAKYPAFKGVVDAFKKNDILKFQMVTSPVNVPQGTELWKRSMAGEKRTD